MLHPGGVGRSAELALNYMASMGDLSVICAESECSAIWYLAAVELAQYELNTRLID
jgi:hypothetical protein